MATGHSVRVLVIGSSGPIGRALRTVWASEPRVQGIWQSRTPLDDGVQFDPGYNAEAFEAAALQADALLDLTRPIDPTTGKICLDLAERLASASVSAAKAANIPLLAASSSAVYGRSDTVHHEHEPTSPETKYGQAKVVYECALGARTDVAACALRIGNVAGADMLLGRICQGTPVKLDRFADGSYPVRNYVGPNMLARILADLVAQASNGVTLPDALNVGASPAVSMNELLECAGGDWYPVPAPPGALRRVELDLTRLRGLLSFNLPDVTATDIVSDWRGLSVAR